MKFNFVTLLLLLSITIVVSSSCFKETGPSCTSNTLTKDKTVIDSFLQAKSLTLSYTFDSQTGLYYYVSNPGNGSAPGLDSLVAFKYNVKLLDNTKVDEVNVSTANNSIRVLQQSNSLIAYALLKLKENGVISIIVPSSLAYGCTGGRSAVTGQLVIPPNAQLIYEFTLLDVKQ